MKFNFWKQDTFHPLKEDILRFSIRDEHQLDISTELSSVLSIKSKISLDDFKALWIKNDQVHFDKLLKMTIPYKKLVETLEHKVFKLVYLPKTNEGYLIYLPEISDYQQKVSSLEKVIKKQEAFLYQMSHELKTPLSALSSYIDLLEIESHDKQVIDKAHKMSQALDQGLHQMNNILELSRLSYQKPTIKKDVISITRLINDIQDLFDAELKKKGLYLHVIHQDKFVFESDMTYLKQILTNLLSNAIKFTISGGIDLETALNEKNLYIKISDTGIGMTEKEQDNLFKVFSQANEDISVKFGGSGLGLSITKELVHLLSGSINVSSTYGSGTTFEINIPITLTDKKPIGEQDHKTHLPEAGLSILVVEDNRLSLQATEQLLKKIELNVTTALDGKEAISMALEYPYDLILMDVSMPIVDGFEATKKIRENDEKIPIIAMTANTYQDHIKACLDSGMTDILYKPFKSKQLYQIIYKHTHK